MCNSINPIYIICFITVLLLTNCNIYSFSGASISEDVKTVSISYIQNQASLIQPSLSNNITESLTNKCLTETPLDLVENNGDISFSGTITNYMISPVAINNTETASQNRLSITVEITFINKYNPDDNFTKLFSQYADFNSNSNFSEIEEDLCSSIILDLVDDIFNQSLVNW